MSEPIRPLSRQAFSEFLSEARSLARKKDLTLRELHDLIGPRGHLLLTLTFALPFAQPVPLPGLSVPLGLLIFLAGIFMAMDRPPWLPERLAKLAIPSRTLTVIFASLETVSRRLESWGIRPSGLAFFTNSATDRLIGLTIAWHALLLALPLPIPATNFLPGLVLVLTSLAALEKNLILLALATLAFIINSLYFIAVVALPLLGLQSIFVAR